MFGNIKEKVGQTGRDALQKTKNLVEENRINGLISEKENAEALLLRELGGAYYDKYSSSLSEITEPEFLKLMQDISAGREAIQSYKAQINKIRNIVICDACGIELPYDSLFCRKCGQKIVKPEIADEAAEKARFCLSCGAALLDDALFCLKCGKEVPK